MSSRRTQYNCERCPAYCCSYPQIRATDSDIARLAAHFGKSVEEARHLYTKRGTDGKAILRHKQDDHYGTACMFLDRESRACTIYKARPRICRDFPGTGRCGYYDFLMFERRLLEDPEMVSTTWNG